ncbi:MAG TPA: threonine--tRNA ligase [Thermoplasmataceae archaeon]|nr:threonine--tRNA ligase [Thermoplasmataceae archaeon]
MNQKVSASLVKGKKGQRVGDVLGATPGSGIVAARGNGVLYDLRDTLTQDADLEPVLISSPDGLRILRHSAAHLLAQAVVSIFPDALPNAGPPTDEGFYYDFDMKPIGEDDLAKIEKRMKELVSRNMTIVKKTYPKNELINIFRSNPYKLDKIKENVPDGTQSSVYEQDGFVDFCRGPHVMSTGQITALKLLSIASTNYKGDPKLKPMVRIYGTAFPTQRELEQFMHAREEALKRDHRKIAQEMDLLVFNTERAPGFPFYTPNGMVLRGELMDFMRQLNRKYGWEEVSTPHLYRDIIWKQSGHYAKYKPNMYLFTLEDGDGYGVKPMNCPGHITIFEREPKSYREMPVKYCEPGTVYRYEKSGEVGGLTRPRMFTIDDGHGFLRLDQIVSEIRSVLEMVKETYSTVFGPIDMAFDLSVIDKNHPEDYLIAYRCNRCGHSIESRKSSSASDLTCDSCGSADLSPDFTTWDDATEQLKKALDSAGITYKEYPGEAAFYGPKIDVHVKDAIGRMWQLATIQLDFFMPNNFGLYYINAESKHDRIVMVHRAIFGSYERFMAILIEHYAGKFPTWLSPLQCYIVPVSSKFEGYARDVEKTLRAKGIRAVADLGTETMNKKIRLIRVKRPSYIAVVGEREENDRTISVRNREDKQVTMGLDDFAEKILEEIRTRSPVQRI